MANPKRITLWEPILQQIARQNGLTTPRLEFGVGSKIGDNFVCDLIRCAMIEESDPKKSIHLMLKAPPESEAHRIRYQVDEFFKYEAAMYETVLPALAQGFKERGLLESNATFPNTVRIYAVDANEGENAILVMEDLGHRGFIMKDKVVGLNASHCKLILQRLARMHAASLALQVQNPQLHEKLVGQLKESDFDGQIPHSYSEAMEACRSLINGRFPNGTKVRERFEKYALQINEILLSSVKRNSTFCCITHGDLWTNNILFQYEEGSTEPIDLYFLDFQFSRMVSPILDIAYLFCFCARKEGRKGFHDLIKAYYESLSQTLSDLGHNPETKIPWNLFHEELQKYLKFGWGIAVRHLPTAFLDVKELQDLQKILLGNANVKSTFKLPQNTSLLAKVFGDLLEDFVELGFM